VTAVFQDKVVVITGGNICIDGGWTYQPQN